MRTYVVFEIRPNGLHPKIQCQGKAEAEAQKKDLEDCNPGKRYTILKKGAKDDSEETGRDDRRV